MTSGTLAEVPNLMRSMTGDEKHSPAAHSTLDVLWVLYDRILRIDSDAPAAPDRDRLLVSKGHGPQALYAILAAKGFIDAAELATYRSFDSSLGGHPDRTMIPGVEIGSGSLGHGLPIAVGRALGLDLRGSPARVFCLIGDGELDEGSNHEAIAFAGRLGMERLTAIVVDNSSSTHGWPGGIEARFGVEGWATASCDGRDHDDIERALTRMRDGRPLAVVASTEPRG